MMFAVLWGVTVASPMPAMAQCAAPPSGMTSWWPGDGNSDDVSGGVHATLQGGAGYTAGLVGQAFQLDGIDDYVDVAADPAIQFGTGDFTVDLWVRFNNTSGEQVLIEQWIDGVSGWTLTKLDGNSVRLALAGAGQPTSAAQSLPDGTWIHFAARRSGSSVAVFMNGAQIIADVASSNLDSASSLKFGRRGDGRGLFLNGAIDEVHMFVGRALSDGEIQAIYNAGSGGLCGTTVCGDGIRQGSEACDDGNLVAGDGCENDCRLSCGNGAITGSEECDDGNLIDGDGCDSNCRPTGCPNGVRTGTETCDDGNATDTDACKSDCTDNVCGDGSINAGVEECDDGNVVDGDGCDSNCRPTGCPNGVRTGAETCDDGNAVDTDACKNDCTDNVCGDGVVNASVEECDDGNVTGGDGCEPDCTIGDICIAPPVALSNWWPAEDSNGDIAGGRNAVLRDGCGYAQGKVGRAFVLDGTGDFVEIPSHPSLNVSTSDFTVDLWVNFAGLDGEQVLIEKYVEKFNPEASSGWTLTKLGNNVLRFVAKTDGVDSSRLSITPATWVHFAARRSGTELAVFVNGVQLRTATAHAVVDLSSSASLKLGHRGSPADTAGSTDTRGFFLNGRIDEVHVVARALSNAEIAAIHHAGGAGLCVPTPACGNGFTESGEACDDGNATGDDGCENDCTPSCGNAVAAGTEACDDGNATEGDGCDSNCTVSACGNGIAGGTEACDDGNLEDGDGCDSNCTETACGNAVRTGATGENCDDGNLLADDGCEPDCTATPVSETVAPGGTVTTDPGGSGATAQAPLQLALTTPDGGNVSISAPDGPLTQEGVDELVTQLLIEAPPATVEEPLVIVLTVDASAIPPGVDLLRVDLTRNGKIVPACTGATGTADPDPCIQSRVLLAGGDVQITALTSHASLWGVVVRGLFKNEQQCVNGVNKAGGKVAKAQSKLDADCLKDANAGKEPDPQACTAADTDGKVEKARQKTISVATDDCIQTPPFGFTSAAAINAAAQEAVADLIADLFGSDLNAASTGNRDIAACQKAVLSKLAKAFDTKTKLLLTCAADGLAGRPSVMVSAPELAACYATVDADADSKAAKSIGKLAGALIDKCDGVDLIEAFPGSCASSQDVSYCLETRIDCRLCQMFNVMDGVDQDCDRFDDAVMNASCN